MIDVNKNLAKELSVEPIVDIPPNTTDIEMVSSTGPAQNKELADITKDYEEIRSNIKEIIKKSNGAIDGILNIARETDKPIAYEVAADLIRATLEANERLMALHQKVKEIKMIGNISNINSNTTTTNNSIYVGSTKDLINLIKQHRQIIDEPEIPEIPETPDIIDSPIIEEPGSGSK